MASNWSLTRGFKRWLGKLVSGEAISSHRRKRNGRGVELKLEVLEDRLAPAGYVFIDYGDNLPTGGLNTTIGALQDVASATNPNDRILGPTLKDLTLSGGAAGTPVSITRAGFSPAERAQMLAVIQRAFRPLNVTVVELTPTAKTLADGRTVAAAASLTPPSAGGTGTPPPDVVTTLRSGNAAFRDAYVIVGNFSVGSGSTLNTNNNGSGNSPITADADLLAAANLHDDVGVVFALGAGGDFRNTMNNIAHEAGHLLGLQHSITDVNTGPTRINMLHQSELMSYVNTNSSSSSMFSRYPMIRGDENTPFYDKQASFNSATRTITLPSGVSFPDGFAGGQLLSITKPSSNAGFFKIKSVSGAIPGVSGGVMTLEPGPALTTASSVTVYLGLANPTNLDDLGPRNAGTYYEQLANDANVGSNFNFVSGTGAHDVITIRRDGLFATVTVQAFSTPTYVPGTAIFVPGTTSITIGPITIPLPGSTVLEYSIPLDKPILIYGGDGDDRFVIDADLGVPIEIDGMLGLDTLVVNGKNVPSLIYSPGATVPGTDVIPRTAEDPAVPAMKNVDSYEGILTAGSTSILFRDFDPSSIVTVQNAGAVTMVTPFRADVLAVTSPAPGISQVLGLSDDKIFVPLRTASVTKLIIDAASQEGAGGADDFVFVNLPDNSSMQLAVNAGSGVDRLIFNDAANVVAFGTTSYTIDAAQIRRVAIDTIPAFRQDSATVEFSGIENLDVETGLIFNQVSLSGLLPGTNLKIQGGQARNLVNIQGADGTLDPIAGTVTYIGGDAYDAVSIIDQSPAGSQHLLGAGEYTRIRPGGSNLVVKYSQVEQVNLETDAAPRAMVDVVVAGTSAPVTIRQHRNESNGVTLGNLGLVQGIVHDVTIDNAPGDRTFLTVDNHADSVYQGNVIVTADSISNLAPATIHFPNSNNAPAESSLSGFRIRHGSGGSKTVVQATPHGAYVNIDCGSGNDEIVLENLRGSHNITLKGFGGADTLRINDTRTSFANVYTVDTGVITRNTPTVQPGVFEVATITHEGFETLDLLAGFGPDQVTVRGSHSGQAVIIDGGGGNDTLVGGSGGETLRGNRGNDILLGSTGADVLEGGDGRDLLIGGLGVDTVDGGADPDIVIGPYTSFDAAVNLAALNTIMAEWARKDPYFTDLKEDYRARVEHLRSGVGGENGNTVLSVANGTRTVFDDPEADILRGGVGALDWFFANTDVGMDQLPDLEKGEIVSKVKSDTGNVQAKTSIDARALSGDYFWVDGVRYDLATPFQALMSVGQHTLLTGGGTPIYFSVLRDGTVDYDPALEGILSGKGTTILTLLGTTITLDARQMTIGRLAFNASSFTNASDVVLSLRVLPGRQWCGLAGGLVYFNVSATGVISYDPTLEGIVLGQGTNALTLRGVSFTIDARQLTLGWLAFDGYTFDPTSIINFRMLPGTHFFWNPRGAAINLIVAADGTLDYDHALDAFITGRGTTNLVLIGTEVTIDARIYGNTSLYFEGIFFDTSTVFRARVLPGTHGIEVGSILVSFTVGFDGLIDYAAIWDGILGGRHTKSLAFLQFPG